MVVRPTNAVSAGRSIPRTASARTRPSARIVKWVTRATKSIALGCAWARCNASRAPRRPTPADQTMIAKMTTAQTARTQNMDEIGPQSEKNSAMLIF